MLYVCSAQVQIGKDENFQVPSHVLSQGRLHAAQLGPSHFNHVPSPLPPSLTPQRPIWLELLNSHQTAIVREPVGLILKLGDDLRQDMITLQVLSLFEKVSLLHLRSIIYIVEMCIQVVCVCGGGQ